MKKKILELLLKNSNEKQLAQYVPLFSKWLAQYCCINDAWVKPETYGLFQENGFHLVRNHFYGVLPDTRELKDSWWTNAAYQTAYEQIQKANIDDRFERILQWSTELQNIPGNPDDGFYWNNPMFPPLDAVAYYGMLREYQPSLLIEIGSGFSTEIALLAAHYTKTSIHCIEPYPSKRLLAIRNQIQTLTQKPVQEVDYSVFEQLKAGDFLFIDTSHTVKIGSDVNHLLFNIFPRLASGVIIHIHDIFLPYEYPRRWYDEISIFWNEQYFLLSYLMQNPTIELLLPNYALSIQYEAQLRERFKCFDIWNITENLGGARGASFWIRKV